MKITAHEYQAMADKASPPSKVGRNIPLAFLVGGAICTLGQILLNVYKNAGLEPDTAGAATSVSLVFLSALLTGLHVYDNIAKLGGAGALVPITGFANAMVSPALEFKSEGLIVGLGGKLFSIAGAVICYGLSAGVLYGLIIFLLRLY